MTTLEAHDIPSLERFIAAGYTPPAATVGDSYTYAASRDSIDLLEALLQSTWDLNTYNRAGRTALSVAVENELYINAARLTEAGASPLINDQSGTGLSPILWAVHTGNTEIFRRLSADLKVETLSPTLQRLYHISRTTRIRPVPMASLQQLDAFENDPAMPYQERLDLRIQLLGLEPTEEGLEYAIQTEAYHPSFGLADYPFYLSSLSNHPDQFPELLKTWEAQDAAFISAGTYALALAHFEGWAATPNIAFALVCLKDAAANEYPPALIHLAKLYASGTHVEQSQDEARRLYQTAAKYGLTVPLEHFETVPE